MSNADSSKISRTLFDSQLVALKDAAATSTDPCLVGKVIATTDPRVPNLFFDKIQAGFVFRGVYCVARPGDQNYLYVVFDFGCAPGSFCLVPPGFAAVVNVADRYVVAVLDPYLPPAVTADSGCNCHSGSSNSKSRGCLDCDVSAEVTVSDGKIKVRLAGYDIELDAPNWVLNGQTVTVKYHGCGCYCTKGGRADAYYNGQHIGGTELWGDCN